MGSPNSSEEVGTCEQPGNGHHESAVSGDNRDTWRDVGLWWQKDHRLLVRQQPVRRFKRQSRPNDFLCRFEAAVIHPSELDHVFRRVPKHPCRPAIGFMPRLGPTLRPSAWPAVPRQRYFSDWGPTR